MISIQPKWVAKILNGEKTIEIRKTMPKCDLPIDVYIYCTKDNSNGYLYYSFGKTIFHDKYVLIKEYDKRCIIGNGKVVAKFTLNKVDEHHILPTERILPFNWNVEQKLNELCLTKEEVMAYGNGEDYYAKLWHIDNLVIFDKPKELSEFKKCQLLWSCLPHDCINCRHLLSLTKAPQSWCYVEVLL